MSSLAWHGLSHRQGRSAALRVGFAEDPSGRPGWRASQAVLALAVAPDGSWIATGARDGTIWTVDVPTGRKRWQVSGAGAEIGAMTVAADGSWLATAGATVRIWDPVTGDPRATLPGHRGIVTELAVAPDGSWLATAEDPDIRIWDAMTWRCVAVLTGHSHRARALAPGPGGTWLASGGFDGRVLIL